jgi:hypothetical protein
VSSRVKHILVTRFNNRLDERYSNALDSDWLEHRWGLFTKITVPSIAAQAYTDFTWLVLCHKDSPAWLRDRARLVDLPCRVRFLFDAPGDELNDLRDASLDAVLTTRIDSDDAFHHQAMARVQESFEMNRYAYEILNFEVGYQYDYLGERLALVRSGSPPFNTMIHRGPVSKPLSSGGRHGKLPLRYSYLDISNGEPMFVQTLHGENLHNKVLRDICFMSSS